MQKYLLCLLWVANVFSLHTSFADTVDNLLVEYQKTGATQFDALRGKQMWHQQFGKDKRSCVTCHNTNLNIPGKHITTGKLIAPMSPVVNPTRLQKAQFIEKWFFRNCKWTLGRECTPQEKGDFLLFIRD